MNAQNAPQPQQSGIAAQYEQFQHGWQRFDAKESPDRCQGREELRGYLAALDAYAVAQLPAASAKHLEF